MPPKYIDTSTLAALRRDRTIEGTTGVWRKHTGLELRVHILAATDANPAFVDLFPKMNAELKRQEGVGADKDEIDAIRARYYVRMFVRNWSLKDADGADVPYNQDAAVELYAYAHDLLVELAEWVFETRNFRLAQASADVETVKNGSAGTATGEST